MTDFGGEGESSATDRWNRVFDAFTSEYRRRLVFALMEELPGDGVRLPERVMDPQETCETNLELSLRHTHLPKLAEPEYVRWEPNPLRAYRGRNFAEVKVVGELLLNASSELPAELIEGCPVFESRL